MSVWSMFPCNISAVLALFINNHIKLPLHIPTYTQLTLQSLLRFDYISVNTSSIYPSLAVIALTGMCLGVELLVSEQGVIYVSVLYLPVLLCRSLGPQDEYGSLASRTCKYTTVSLFQLSFHYIVNIIMSYILQPEAKGGVTPTENLKS